MSDTLIYLTGNGMQHELPVDQAERADDDFWEVVHLGRHSLVNKAVWGFDLKCRRFRFESKPCLAPSWPVKNGKQPLLVRRGVNGRLQIREYVKRA